MSFVLILFQSNPLQIILTWDAPYVVTFSRYVNAAVPPSPRCTLSYVRSLHLRMNERGRETTTQFPKDKSKAARVSGVRDTPRSRPHFTPLFSANSVSANMYKM